jgi:hypothetical protein
MHCFLLFFFWIGSTGFCFAQFELPLEFYFKGNKVTWEIFIKQTNDVASCQKLGSIKRMVHGIWAADSYELYDSSGKLSAKATSWAGAWDLQDGDGDYLAILEHEPLGLRQIWHVLSPGGHSIGVFKKSYWKNEERMFLDTSDNSCVAIIQYTRGFKEWRVQILDMDHFNRLLDARAFLLSMVLESFWDENHPF